MELSGWAGRFLKICDVISRFAYLNLIWILFTVVGLGFFGLMPATVALFSVVRKWVMNQPEIPIFKTFWKIYRKEFFKSNLLGLILIIIGYILYFDFVVLPTGGIFTALRTVLMVVGLLYGIILLYIFPIYVHYEWKLRLYLQYALLLGASHPHYTVLMGAGLWIVYYVNMSIPGFIPFFSVSVMAYIVMRTTYRIIRRMEASQINREEAATSAQVPDSK